MIFPDKFISPSESIIGVGAYILFLLEGPKTIPLLWKECSEQREITYQKFIFGIDFLYIIGAVKLQQNLLMKVE